MCPWPSKHARLSRKKHKGRSQRRRDNKSHVNADNSIAPGRNTQQPASVDNDQPARSVEGQSSGNSASQSRSGANNISPVMLGALPMHLDGGNGSQASGNNQPPFASRAAAQPPVSSNDAPSSSSGAVPQTSGNNASQSRSGGAKNTQPGPGEGVAPRESGNNESQTGHDFVTNTSSSSNGDRKKYPRLVTVGGKEYIEYRVKSSVRDPHKGTAFTVLNPTTHPPQAREGGEGVVGPGGGNSRGWIETVPRTPEKTGSQKDRRTRRPQSPEISHLATWTSNTLRPGPGTGFVNGTSRIEELSDSDSFENERIARQRPKTTLPKASQLPKGIKSPRGTETPKETAPSEETELRTEQRNDSDIDSFVSAKPNNLDTAPSSSSKHHHIKEKKPTERAVPRK